MYYARTGPCVRFEGHHLSRHHAVVGERLAVYLFFLGARPTRAPSAFDGLPAGYRTMPREEDAGGELVRSLSRAQRRVAIFQEASLTSHVTQSQPRVTPLDPVGICVDALGAQQRRLVDELLRTYLAVLPRRRAPAGPHTDPDCRDREDPLRLGGITDIAAASVLRPPGAHVRARVGQLPQRGNSYPQRLARFSRGLRPEPHLSLRLATAIRISATSHERWRRSVRLARPKTRERGAHPKPPVDPSCRLLRRPSCVGVGPAHSSLKLAQRHGSRSGRASEGMSVSPGGSACVHWERLTAGFQHQTSRSEAPECRVT
jgi:hypothetical protein